jgi:hypothetical protein
MVIGKKEKKRNTFRKSIVRRINVETSSFASIGTIYSFFRSVLLLLSDDVHKTN